MEETINEEKQCLDSGAESINKENNSIKFDSQTSENISLNYSKNQLSMQSPLMSQNLNTNNLDKAPLKSDQKTEKSSEQRTRKIEKTENLSKYSEDSGQLNSKMNSKNHYLNGKFYF
jgi:hypothetical protein